MTLLHPAHLGRVIAPCFGSWCGCLARNWVGLSVLGAISPDRGETEPTFFTKTLLLVLRNRARPTVDVISKTTVSKAENAKVSRHRDRHRGERSSVWPSAMWTKCSQPSASVSSPLYCTRSASLRPAPDTSKRASFVVPRGSSISPSFRNAVCTNVLPDARFPYQILRCTKPYSDCLRTA